MLVDYFGVVYNVCSPIFEKNPNFQNDQKMQGK